MKIGILIFSSPKHDEFTQVERFEEAGRTLGIEVVRLHEPMLSLVSNGSGHINILHNCEVFSHDDYKAIICRPNFIEEPSLHQFTIHAFLQNGARVINGSVLAPKNKLDQHLRLAEAGIAMPRWAIAHRPEEVVVCAESIGYPVILKVAFGTHGKGVFYAPSRETLGPIVDYLAVRDGNPVIVEEFIHTELPPSYEGEMSGGCRDIRAFVLGGRVIAAMERVAKPGDVRANASIGGTGQPVTLSVEEETIAIKTAAAFGLDIAGVDILRSNRGPLVIEANANPGFKELERVTGVDIAKIILEYAIH